MKRPSPALVISIVALIFALGGTSIAAFKLKKNSVGSPQVKNDSLTGADVNEATFGQVPSAAAAGRANDATHAATADNADSLGGFGAGEFVNGLGNQFAFAGIVSAGTAGGLNDFAGHLFIHCDAMPTLSWDNDTDDSGAPATHIWANGGPHIAVADGAAGPTVIDADMSSDSRRVEILTGDDFQLSVKVSSFKQGDNSCLVTVFENEEPNLLGLAAGSRAAKSRPDPRPAGLTTPAAAG